MVTATSPQPRIVVAATPRRHLAQVVVRYGAATERAPRQILEAQSKFCAAALAHDADIALPHCGSSVEPLLRELVAYLATRDAREREALLDACYDAPAPGEDEPAPVW